MDERPGNKDAQSSDLGGAQSSDLGGAQSSDLGGAQSSDLGGGDVNGVQARGGGRV